jgi:guanosine-diphosphatase
MSSGVDVHRRPNIWSYFSFSGPRRRVSVSLPRSINDPLVDDPYEKPDRHSRRRSSTTNGLMNDLKHSTMNGGQRARYLKTGGIIAFIFLVLYFIAPSDSLTRAGGASFDLGRAEDLR